MNSNLFYKDQSTNEVYYVVQGEPLMHEKEVFRGIIKNSSGKRIKEVVIKTFCSDKSETEFINGEFQIYKELSHPHIVTLYAAINEKTNNGERFHLVMENCIKGDIVDYLKDKILTEKEIKDFFHQIVLALSYLHSKGILHRDIKPENIFVLSNKIIKLGDFGIAKKLSQNSLNTFAPGTTGYNPPESLPVSNINNSNNTSNLNASYSFPADIFSLGVTLYYLYYKKTPWEFENNEQDAQKILDNYKKRLKEDIFVGRKISKDAEKLIKMMLDQNPETRITLDEIKASQYLFQNEIIAKMIAKIEDKFDCEEREIDNSRILYENICILGKNCDKSTLEITLFHLSNTILMKLLVLKEILEKRKKWFSEIEWATFYESELYKKRLDHFNSKIVEANEIYKICEHKILNSNSKTLKIMLQEIELDLKKNLKKEDIQLSKTLNLLELEIKKL